VGAAEYAGFLLFAGAACSGPHEQGEAVALLGGAASARATVEEEEVPDTRPLHFATQEELLALVGAPPGADQAFLLAQVKPGSFGAMNQGNPALARHTITRAQCRAGLRGVTLQTPEQRARCGHDNMVPISESACIDVFEFPNKACELPFVWVGPTIAEQLCHQLGKRLCTMPEWVRACSGDPAGGPRQAYAYGDELDLGACHTNLSRKTDDRRCDATSVKRAWDTCGSDTAPSGSFPRCRSRFGVYDLHGNVAEEMTRKDPDGHTYSQLKGSAFFYVDVARVPGIKPDRSNYVDRCDHDPRWHVEDMRQAWHVNYHLGFRCCADLR
jgi:sulfatase modifying factor 1